LACGRVGQLLLIEESTMDSKRLVVLQHVLAVAALTVGTTTVWSQEGAGMSLPMKRVVMFSSGVAFFEHNGEVSGDARVELKFNVRDVNDLLKSMVVQDLGGGQVSAVNYASRDPITRTLKTFAIDLTTNPTLADLLAQIRGERVEIEAASRITGTILGVEKRTVKVGDNDTVEVSILNLLTDEGLRSVSLETVGRIRLLNPKLDEELRQALLLLASAHDSDKKSVSLHFHGQGSRRVRVGYVQESPIWKTTYRLVLDDDEQPLLQGWAIVENTTEQDWNQVDLTLISGRPISFLMDLYEPLYVPRPLVEPELFASLRPQTYTESLAEREKAFSRARAGFADMGDLALGPMESRDAEAALRNRQAAQPGRGAGQGYAAPRPGAAPADRWDPAQGARSVAAAGEVGELFQYHIETPVSLPRQQSAMLPIINASIDVEKVSIYNPSVQPKHPLSGCYLTNSSGFHMMQGPITVFDGGTYAGDAQIMDLAPLSKRLISYALDLDTEVARQGDNQAEELVSCKIFKGTLQATRKYRREHDYVVKNSSKKEKKVLIEYPIDPTWKLVEPQQPEEKTRDLYRFAVTAKPGEPATLHVAEEYQAAQSIVLSNVDDNTVRIYIRAKEVSQAVKDALAEVVRRRQEISDLQAQRRLLEGQITVIGQEQERIRQNMAQLTRNTELYNRYVQKFTEQEDRIEQLRMQIEDLLEQEAARKKALDEYLMNLTVN
jgi:hypothetical protein